MALPLKLDSLAVVMAKTEFQTEEIKMKKIKSILAIVALTIVCAGAIAETADAGIISGGYPRRGAGGGIGGGGSSTG